MEIARNRWAVLSGLLAAVAAAGAFPLGTDYTMRIGYGPLNPNRLSISTNPMIRLDGAGALYVLNEAERAALPPTAVLGAPEGTRASYVMKLSPSGDRVEYVTVLDFDAIAMAVDPAGGVYLIGQQLVAKLDASGTAFAYRMNVREGLRIDALAVDRSGRAYITGRAFRPVSRPHRTPSNRARRTITGPRVSSRG